MNNITAERIPIITIVITKFRGDAGASLPVNKKRGTINEIKYEIEEIIELYINKLARSFAVIAISAGRVKFISPKIVNIVSKTNRTIRKLKNRAI
jgi:hypothetical protein